MQGNKKHLPELADFSAVREALESKGYEFLQAETSMVPSVTIH